jgi:flagellar assembly protein FliH
MQTPRPFLFDKSFDASAAKAAEEKKAAPVFNEQDLAAAKEEAYSQGFMAGKEAAQQETQHRQNQVLGNIQHLFERFTSEAEKIYGRQKQAAFDVAVAIARRMVPEYVKKSGIQEITAAVESGVAEMITEPRLVLRVHETDFDAVSAEVNAMCQRLGYAGKMIILADETLAEKDCRLEWADGGMERSINLTWSEIEQQLARHQGGQVHLPAPVVPSAAEAPASSTDIAV